MWQLKLVVVFLINVNFSFGVLTGGENCTVRANLPCMRYKFKDTGCSRMNLQPNFPELYNDTALFPGAAGSFELGKTGYLLFNNKGPYQYINLNFKPPKNAAKNFVNGFELTITRIGQSPTCYVYDLSDAEWSQSSVEEYNTVFSLYLHPLQPGKVYNFKLYTLPKPPDANTDENNYLELNVAVPEISPNDWIAKINHTKFEKESKIYVGFSPAPWSYNFEEYEVILYHVNNDAVIKQERVPKTQTYLNFTDVQPGTYSVWVKPYDPFFYDQKQCLCKTYECIRCVTSISDNITMVYVPPPTTPAPPTEGPSSTTEREIPEDDALKTILAVIGSLLGLVLISVILGCVYFNHLRKKDVPLQTEGKNEYEDFDDNKNKINRGFDPDSSTITTISFNNKNVNKMKTFDVKPKIILLYEEDHSYHKLVVDRFATYLQHHCHCKVTCVDWQLDFPWVHQDFQDADVAVVINSQGSYHSFVSSKLKQTTSLGSINSIRNKFLQDERYDKTVMAYFDYTSDQFILPDICPGYKYKLMKNFAHFLMHVHKIRRTDNLSDYDLPFDGNHALRPIGQQLLEAISQATQFERDNPQWFFKKYGVAHSYSQQSEQIDSGVPDDLPSPIQTPQVDAPPPDWQNAALRKLLDGSSGDIITISPEDYRLLAEQATQQTENPVYEKQQPILAPLCLPSQDQGYFPSNMTAGSNESGFDFEPPEDFDDFDTQSKTQSEQMKSIVERYQSQVNTSGEQNYDRNSDLLLLQMAHTGTISFDKGMSGDSISLGGESV